MADTTAQPQSDVPSDEPVRSEEPAPRDVPLPRSEPLSIQEAAAIMGAAVTRLVVLGGPFRSGKTTLLVSIYEAFHEGVFAERLFGWSSTLRGFEEICHLGRVTSGLTEPDTARTSRLLGKQIYHLRTRAMSDRKQQDVALTDLSGEVYESVRAHSDASAELALLRRADHFALLLDGAKLVAPEKRHTTTDEAMTIARGLTEVGLLSARTHVQIVFSKWDIIEAADDGPGVAAYVEHVEAEARGRFGSTFASLTFHKTIARDPRGTRTPRGLDTLFAQWCRVRRNVLHKRTDTPSVPTACCEFDRFAFA